MYVCVCVLGGGGPVGDRGCLGVGGDWGMSKVRDIHTHIHTQVDRGSTQTKNELRVSNIHRKERVMV